MTKTKPYVFIGKTLFFPDKGILAVGDLHLGFEYMLQQSGILVPEMQAKEVIEELKTIFEDLKMKKLKLKKIVFIGDVKHSFSYERKEKNYFNEILKFLKDYVNDKNIILIKGNHDTIDYSFSDRLKNYFIDGDTVFIHGNELFKEILDKKIKTIVMGHLHPSIILSDKQNIKKEKYKCFLTGKFKGKQIIILPSFLSTIEGTTINSLEHEYKDYFSIIPKKILMNFIVHVIGEDKVYSFGKIKNMKV
ncbi:MAG: metallophosphoesterase [Nanoarchaeota archaeon]